MFHFGITDRRRSSPVHPSPKLRPVEQEPPSRTMRQPVVDVLDRHGEGGVSACSDPRPSRRGHASRDLRRPVRRTDDLRRRRRRVATGRHDTLRKITFPDRDRWPLYIAFDIFLSNTDRDARSRKCRTSQDIFQLYFQKVVDPSSTRRVDVYTRTSSEGVAAPAFGLTYATTHEPEPVEDAHRLPTAA
jgi:hypothetical protein